MTPEQRLLARHALGLPNERGRSYRNRYLVPPAHPSHALFMQMVAAGEARLVVEGLSNDRFCLTLEGAGKAVNPGEKLDPDDFLSPDGR